MISVILYGRNDNYGYNLHKRAALSLNSIAEVLCGKSDEIVFVDYNTPDDLPTFPEAIADTLTTRARERLRVLRVRPNIHERFRSKTHLVALEPIARNAGVRRSEPSNRWILSTNTDLVFVTKKQESLNEVVQSLPSGLYHTPRIEIPEALWESLDRKNPRAAIQSIRNWGWTLHLNEIVYGNETILYDGPGDFQLLERQRLFDINGFNEEMLLGWHVDSNLAKRMQLLLGAVGDLGSQVYAYHCDHTRQATPMHSHVRIENDWRRFVADLARADIPEQAHDWGCAQDEIEEIRLGGGQARFHVTALQQAIGKRLREPLVAHYTGGSASGANYDALHVVPFLIDLLCSYPKNAVVGWCGARIDTLRVFTRAWNSLGFDRPVLVDNSLVDSASFATVLDTRLVSSDTLRSRATVFVFDFGTASGTGAGHNQDNVAKLLLEMVNIERRRFTEGMPLRKLVTIGAINNEYEKLVARHVGAGYVPFSTRIRHGYVLLPFHGEQNWLPALEPAEAGIRDGRFLRSREDRIGIVGYGAYQHLPTGCYRLSIKFELNDHQDQSLIDNPCVAIELRSSFHLFAIHALTLRDLRRSQALLFDVPESIGGELDSTIEVRLITVESVAFTVRSLTVESVRAVPLANSILRISNWLPFLSSGPNVHRDGAGVTAYEGSEGYIVTGPYWPLPLGRYELNLSLDAVQPPRSFSDDEVFGSVEVAVGANEISGAPIRPRDLARGRLRLLFEILSASRDGVPALVETRVWASGKTMFRVRGIAVRQQDDADILLPLRTEQDWLQAVEPGEAGTRTGRSIISRHGQIGIVAIDTRRHLPSGKYQLNVDFGPADVSPQLPPNEPCIQIELRSSAQLFALHFLKIGELPNPPSLVFDVPSVLGDGPDIEIRVLKIQPITVVIEKLTISPITSVGVADSILRIGNWLPFLNVELGHYRHDGVVEAKRGRDGHMVFGPYWPLSRGRYAMLAVLESLEPLDNVDDGECLALADIAINATAIAIVKLGPWELARKRIRLNFEVPAVADGNVPSLIETRIWTAGKIALSLSSVSLRPWLEEDDAIDIQPGPAGRWDGNIVRERSSTLGCIACCQLPFGLGSGPQRFRLDYETIDDLVQGPADQICLRVELHRGGHLLKAQDLRRDELNRIKDTVFEIPRPTADKADVAFEFRVVLGGTHQHQDCGIVD